MIHSLYQFAKKDLFSNTSRFVIGVISIAVGTGLLFLFLVIISSLFTISEQKLSSGQSVDEVQVIPKFSVGFFKVTKQEQRSIDDEVLQTLRELPGVEGVRAEGVLQYPSSLEVSVFNTAFETDSPIYGIDDTLFYSLAAKKREHVDSVPVLVAQQLVDIYNLGIAQAIRKPQLNEEFLEGFQFQLKLGYSSFFRSEAIDKIKEVEAEVVGVVEEVPIVGVTMPLSQVEKYNRELLGEDYVPTYPRAFVKMGPLTTYESLKKHIEDLGFEAISLQEQLNPIKSQLSYVSFILVGIVSLVLLVIVLNIFFLFYSQYRERKYTLALLKTFGGYSRDVAKLFFYQAALIAGWGIGIGVIIGLLGVLIGNLILTQQFPFLVQSIGMPLDLLWWHPLVVIVGFIFLIFLAIIYPTVRAAMLLPKKVLAEN